MKQPSLLDRRRFLLGAAPAVTIAALGVSACSNSNRHADLSTYSPRLLLYEGSVSAGQPRHVGVPTAVLAARDLPTGNCCGERGDPN